MNINSKLQVNSLYISFVNQMKNLWKSDLSFLFVALKRIFSNPMGAIATWFSFLKNINLDNFFAALPASKDSLAKYFETNQITVENIGLALLFFVCFYLLFKTVIVDICGVAENKFSKWKIIGYIFIAVWTMLSIIVYLAPSTNSSDFLSWNLSDFKNFLVCIAFAIAASMLFTLAISFMPEVLMAVSVITPLIITIVYFKKNLVPKKEMIFLAGFLFLIVFITGVVLKKYFKKYSKSLRNASLLIYKNFISLLIFLITVSIIHYWMISITTSLWAMPYGTNAYFFIYFLNTWAHFTASYCITMFISSIFSKDSNGSFFKSLSRVLDSFDLICVSSLFSSLFQTVIFIIDALYSVTRHYNSLFWKLLSYLLYGISFILNSILFIVDSYNNDQVIQIGILGLDGYFQKTTTDIEPKKLDAISSFVLALEGSPHLLLTMVSITTFRFYFCNTQGLFFSLFVACNIFIYFLNSIIIAHKVLTLESENSENKVSVDTKDEKKKAA